MATITGIVFVKKIAFGNATPGGLIGEVWRVPASTAADDQSITCKYIQTPIAVIGAVSHTAITTSTLALITSVTVAGSNFVEILILGYSAP